MYLGYTNFVLHLSFFSTAVVYCNVHDSHRACVLWTVLSFKSLWNMQVEMPNGNQDIGLELSSLVSLILKWELSAGRGMCYFLIAAVINYHKCIGSKQCTFIILQFWKPAVWNVPPSWRRRVSRPVFLLEPPEVSISGSVPASRGCLPSSVQRPLHLHTVQVGAATLSLWSTPALPSLRHVLWFWPR